MKIYPVEQATKELYCRFTDNAINITGKVILRFSQMDGLTGNAISFKQKDTKKHPKK